MEEEEEGIVSRLLALRRRKPDSRVQYLVRWAVRTAFHDSWEDEARLPAACVREYYEEGARVKRKKKFKQKEVVTSKDSAQVAVASVGSKRRRISSKVRGAVAQASMHGSSGTCSTSSATAASLSAAGVKSHRDMTLRGDDDDDWMP